jgi:hypothetical protein
MRSTLLAALLVTAVPCSAFDVERVELDTRERLDAGPFGAVGAYERLAGTIHFAWDPAAPANARIVDLDLAPRDADGLVRAHATLYVLQPVARRADGGTALLEVSNRGGKASLAYFNGGAGASEPRTAAHLGDGLLMRRGLTLIWVGWQADVPAGGGRVKLFAPRATGADGPLTGRVRCDWVVDRPAPRLALGHRGHAPYAIDAPASDTHVLTVRDGREAARRTLARDTWSFVDADGRPSGSEATHVALEGGFQAGRIYELVYTGKDPLVIGLGLAAVRDALSYAKHDEHAAFPVARGVGVGISQTGRFLRHFLYEGCNTDEAGRQVFDGLLVHTAGAGRGSFNHRFAQPSRDAHRYSAFFYPTDLFPFSGRAQDDPRRDGRAGLLDRHAADGHLPRIVYTNTGYEYWGRAASLLHTAPDGRTDVRPLPEERIYHLAGAQHFPVPFPPRGAADASGAFKGNPLELLLTERALLVALLEWVERDAPPPPSTYPTLAAGTLVPLADVRPACGMPTPRVAHVAYPADYGPEWPRRVTLQPPALGAPYATLVPDVDRCGNELGGVRALELRVPLATYAPWHLRDDGELTDFFGTFQPLARTASERAPGDPRPALDELYDGSDDYTQRCASAADALIAAGFLLPEDRERALEAARRRWDWAQAER